MPAEVEKALSGEIGNDQKITKGETDEHLFDTAAIAQMNALKVQKRYYHDALKFVGQLNKALPILCQLLASTSKTEVVEAMEFFVFAYQFGLEEAQVTKILLKF